MVVKSNLNGMPPEKDYVPQVRPDWGSKLGPFKCVAAHITLLIILIFTHV